MATKKYVLSKLMHISSMKQSFAAGTVIEHDEVKDLVIVEGRKFEGVKEIGILTKKGLAVPYSEEVLKKYKNVASVQQAKRNQEDEQSKPEAMKELPVERSDADTHKTIDISHTRKQAMKPREVNNDLEVIRGDETYEERIKRLQAQPMPVVKNDNLTAEGPALNEPQEKKAKVMPVVKQDAEITADLEKTPDGSGAANNVKTDETPVKRGRGRPKGSVRRAKKVAEGIEIEGNVSKPTEVNL